MKSGWLGRLVEFIIGGVVSGAVVVLLLAFMFGGRSCGCQGFAPSQNYPRDGTVNISTAGRRLLTIRSETMDPAALKILLDRFLKQLELVSKETNDDPNFSSCVVRVLFPELGTSHERTKTLTVGLGLGRTTKPQGWYLTHQFTPSERELVWHTWICTIPFERGVFDDKAVIFKSVLESCYDGGMRALLQATFDSSQLSDVRSELQKLTITVLEGPFRFSAPAAPSGSSEASRSPRRRRRKQSPR